MTTELSRRSLLKAGALGATAAVLGWRPIGFDMPAALSLPAAQAMAPEAPFLVTKMRAFVSVSNEALEDVPQMMAYIEDTLRRVLVTGQHEATLIEPYGPEKIERAAAIDDWASERSIFRLTQEWLAEPVPG